MIMSFDRFRTQVAIELDLGCADLSQWGSYKGSFTNYQIDEARKNILLQELKDDALDLYFKGVHSITSAIFNISEGNHSWSVVKLYYAIFYLMRCSLATKNIAFLKNKGIYSLEMKIGEKPIKRDCGMFQGQKVSGDHKSTIKAYVDIVGQGDVLQTNKIDEMLVYEWIMELRNQVNYRERVFHEPDIKHFPSSLFDVTSVKEQIETYLNDADLVYCFDETHCCIAAPLKLLSVVKDELISFYPGCSLSLEKKEAIDLMLDKTSLPNSTIFTSLYKF